MSYIEDMTSALVKVITRANSDTEEKFAGYAANRTFWVAEAGHCLELIQRYPERFERMRKASQGHGAPRNDPPVWSIELPSSNQRAFLDCERQIQECMRRFLKRCEKLDHDYPGPESPIWKECRKLGISTPL